MTTPRAIRSAILTRGFARRWIISRPLGATDTLSPGMIPAALSATSAVNVGYVGRINSLHLRRAAPATVRGPAHGFRESPTSSLGARIVTDRIKSAQGGRMWRRRVCVMVAAFGVTLACGDSTDPSQSLTGRWTASSAMSGQFIDVSVYLTERQMDLTGTGTIEIGPDEHPLSVTGRHEGQAVSLALEYGTQVIQFAGTVTRIGDYMSMSGTFNGNDAFSVTFYRQ